MEERRQSFSDRLRFYLSRAEQALLALALIGLILRYANLPWTTVVMLALSGLACVFFLSAYLPPEPVEADKNTRLGFKDLLMLTILPKVMGIACSVSAIGILFFLLGLKGYRQMVMIGGGTIVIGLLILGIGFITETRNIKSMMPMLHRGIPLVLLDVYLFMQNA